MNCVILEIPERIIFFFKFSWTHDCINFSCSMACLLCVSINMIDFWLQVQSCKLCTQYCVCYITPYKSYSVLNTYEKPGKIYLLFFYFTKSIFSCFIHISSDVFITEIQNHLYFLETNRTSRFLSRSRHG